MASVKSGSGAPKDDNLFRIPPFFYIHVLDQNTNVTRLEIGPKIYIRQDNERSVAWKQLSVVQGRIKPSGGPMP